MSDPTNTNSASVADQIAAMVGAQPTQGPGRHSTPDLRYDSATGETTVLAPAAHPADAVDTPAMNPAGELEVIDNKLAQIDNELSATDGHDPVTGAPIPHYAGRDRDILHAQRVSLLKSREFQVDQNAKVQAIRDVNSAAAAAAREEELARAAFTRGDAKRTDLLNGKLAEEEAREVARLIVASRKRA